MNIRNSSHNYPSKGFNLGSTRRLSTLPLVIFVLFLAACSNLDQMPETVVDTPIQKAAVAGQAEYNDRFGTSLAVGDFDGDGDLDLAVGVPFEDIGNGFTDDDHGAVNMFMNEPGGFKASSNNYILSQEQFGGIIEDGFFGYVLAAADFDNDGIDDLAVGVPGATIQGEFLAGAVHVFMGDGSNDFLFQGAGSNGIFLQGVAEAEDWFGQALTTGDFDNDGFDDLAIGVPGEHIASTNAHDAGVVHVLYGGSTGLSLNGDQLWHQEVEFIEGQAEDNDRFGQALASGDFNGDGRDDLAIGVQGEMIDGQAGAGAVNIIFSRNSGNGKLAANGDQVIHQNTDGIKGVAEVDDHFGTSLAAGDFNNDTIDDLAIGVPHEDIGGIVDAGGVQIMLGSQGELSKADFFWHQDKGTMEGKAELGDEFGWSVTVGDFNGDGRDDLAVGVPHEEVIGEVRAGAVNVLYNSNSGLTITGDQIVHQVDYSGTPEAYDRFGWVVAAGNFNNDNDDELIIGVPGEGIEPIEEAGAVQIIYSSGGILSSSDTLIHQDSQ